MGLEEKRLIKRLREEVLPQRQQELEEITGAEITYDIDWDSFADSKEAMTRFEANAFKSINEAFRKICRDDMGKESIQEGVKTIRISQNPDAEFTNVTMIGGILTIPWEWVGWGGSLWPDSLVEIVEAAL